MSDHKAQLLTASAVRSSPGGSWPSVVPGGSPPEGTRGRGGSQPERGVPFSPTEAHGSGAAPAHRPLFPASHKGASCPNMHAEFSILWGLAVTATILLLAVSV